MRVSYHYWDLELRKKHLLNKIGLDLGQKHLFITPLCDYNYFKFCTEIISKIDNAILIVFDSMDFGPFSKAWYQNIGRAQYDRHARHLGNVRNIDLCMLIDLTKGVVLPDPSVLIVNYNDFLMSAIMRAKPVIKSDLYNPSLPNMIKENTINIDPVDNKKWVQILTEIISYPEDVSFP